MAEAGFEVRGLEPILEKIRAIGPDLAQTLSPASEQALALLRDRLREYPPERSNQRYERTGALGAGWEVFPGGSGEMLGSVQNVVPYARYVQDAEAQAWMHQGRWQTVQDVAAEKEAEVAELLADFLEGFLNQ